MTTVKRVRRELGNAKDRAVLLGESLHLRVLIAVENMMSDMVDSDEMQWAEVMCVLVDETIDVMKEWKESTGSKP